MTLDPDAVRLHVMITIADGTVVVDEDICDASNAMVHADAAMAHGQPFQILITDPDGEMAPMVRLIVPDAL